VKPINDAGRAGRIVSVVAMVLAATVATVATQQTPAGSRRVAISPVQSMELPRSCRATLTMSFVDAWAGRVDCGRGSFSIEYAMGLVESIAGSGTEIWTRRTRLADGRLHAALLRDRKGLIVTAILGWASFRARVATEAQAEEVYRLLQTLAGPCPKCERATVAGK
jgi:hypothetical protein